MDTPAAWHPWEDIRRIQRDVERLHTDLAPTGGRALMGEYPPINLTRHDRGLTLEALCPGVSRDTLDVTVVGDAVTVRCERKPEPGIPEDSYHRRERPLGTFTRTIAVGDRFDPDRSQATYVNGLLRVQLERAAEAQPTKISVQG